MSSPLSSATPRLSPAPTPFPFPRAARVAALVHQRLGMDGPPASAAMLVAHAPIDVRVEDWPQELAGLLLLRNGRATIGLNRAHAPTRRHFSFWHEVGHYLLHTSPGRGRPAQAAWTGPPCLGSKLPGTTREAEADAFAACVLMPLAWVNRASAEGMNLSALARRFMVGPTAMERRLRELGLDRHAAAAGPAGPAPHRPGARS